MGGSEEKSQSQEGKEKILKDCLCEFGILEN